MLNNVILVGRVKEVEEAFLSVVIEIVDKDNTEEKDVLRVYFEKGMFEGLKKYLKPNQTVGIKASLKSKPEPSEMYLAGEKITFIGGE